MTDKIVNRNSAAALLAGAMLGAGIALLLAPQSGRKTRRDICQFAEKAGNRAEAIQLELKHSVNKILGDIEEMLQEGVASGVDWTDSKIDDLRRVLEKAGKSIAGEIEKIQLK